MISLWIYLQQTWLNQPCTMRGNYWSKFSLLSLDVATLCIHYTVPLTDPRLPKSRWAQSLEPAQETECLSFVYVQIFVLAHLMVQQFECNCVQVRPKINTHQFPCSFQIFTRYLLDIRSMKNLVETQVHICEKFSFKNYFIQLLFRFGKLISTVCFLQCKTTHYIKIQWALETI